MIYFEATPPHGAYARIAVSDAPAHGCDGRTGGTGGREFGRSADFKIRRNHRGQFELSVLYTYPSDATEAYTWVNSNDKYIAITPSEDGKRCTVEGLKDGKAYVSVVSASGKTLSRCLVTVKTVRVSSVSLNNKALILPPGATYELRTIVKPSNATYKSATWRSSDEKVLKIVASDDDSATIQAVGKGPAYIYATTRTRKVACRVTVKDLTVTSVKFPSKKRTVYLHSPVPVKVTPVVSPSTAPDTTLTYKSSKVEVATIAEDGTLTLHGVGTTIITARSVANPAKYAECTVYVSSRPIKSLTLTGGPDGPLNPGETATLTASALPADADDRSFAWTSDKSDVVKVTDPTNGAIEAVGPGYADLTATSNANPNVKLTVRVYVRGGAMKSIWIAGGGDAVIGGEMRTKHPTSARYDVRFDDMINNVGGMADDPLANGSAYQHVSKFFNGKNVIGILSLEVTLTNSKKPINKTFTFRGKPEYAGSILAANGIDVVTLANNHTVDFGSGGYRDTQRALDRYGVKYCGSGVSSPKNIVTTENGVRVGFLGYVSQYASASTVRKQVKALKTKCNMVVVSYHWTDVAQFYYRKPNSKQRALAHAAIDAGAKLVLGHHVHRVNGVEKYKDGYIAYDLANFMTNAVATQNKPSADNPMAKQDFDSIIYRQNFNVFEDGYVEAVGLTDGGIEIVPISTTSTKKLIDGKPINNSMPKPYTEPADINRVLDTLNRFSINFSYRIR